MNNEQALPVLLIEVYGDPRSWAVLHCPMCVSDIHDNLRSDKCPKCGQKLDWDNFITIRK